MTFIKIRIISTITASVILDNYISKIRFSENNYSTQYILHNGSFMNDEKELKVWIQWVMRVVENTISVLNIL